MTEIHFMVQWDHLFYHHLLCCLANENQPMIHWSLADLCVTSGFLLQICVWGTDGWEKQRSRILQIPSGRTSSSISDTRVQFHQDQIHFLAVHETQIAIYETAKLECVNKVFLFLDWQFGKYRFCASIW